MISVGFFSEMNLTAHNDGSINEHIADEINYDKTKIIEYLQSFKHKASCPREAIDCLTGKVISSSFKVFDDGEYCWSDFLIYHIRKYNIKLPKELINKAKAHITAQ